MDLTELVACTLTTDDLKTQGERWTRLAEAFGVGRSETHDGLRLRFRYHPAIEAELRALVAVENTCCSWAAWEVERAGETLVVSTRSQGEGIATLHTMFTTTF